MNRMHVIRFGGFGLWLGLAALAATGWAQPPQLPAGAPETVQETGTIDEISVKEGIIVVDDRQFKISAQTQVVTPDGRGAALASLKKGTKIGYMAIDPEQPTVRRIVKIWVIQR